MYYLSPKDRIDADGDGKFNDIDANATRDLLSFAINEWAADAQEVIVFMTGHGGNGTFVLNGMTEPVQTITPDRLDSWFDRLQKSSHAHLIFVYDACRAGTFVPAMVPSNGQQRVIITGSGDTRAWFAQDGYISFFYQFWSSIYQNARLYDAWVRGQNILSTGQKALIHVNGNPISNESDDKYLACQTWIGRGKTVAIKSPSITDVSPTRTLNGDTTSTINVRVIRGSAPIQKVGAFIVSPEENYRSADTPLTQLDNFELDNTGDDGVYQGGWTGFTVKGTYKIVIHAVDTSGEYAASKSTDVIQLKGDEPDGSGDTEIQNGYKITSNLWIRSVIHSEKQGAIEAIWQKGGDDVTAKGHRCIWGHFYASPDDVIWGSSGNPDLFVKIWFDASGRIDVNYFHVSVPDIDVYSDYPFDARVDQLGTLTMSRRYIRHYYQDGKSNSESMNEKGFPPAGYSKEGKPEGTGVMGDLTLAAIIHTAEKGPIEAIWRLVRQDTTSRGDRVMWGFFYANPDLVSWGSMENPDLFVKIWKDASGRLDANFFHASVPNIEVYSNYSDSGDYEQTGTTTLQNRYIRHEYW